MVSGYVFVNIEPGKNEEVVSALRAIEGVQHAHVCWGLPDILAFVEADDYGALADTALVAIPRVPGIRSSEVHIVVTW